MSHRESTSEIPASPPVLCVGAGPEKYDFRHAGVPVTEFFQIVGEPTVSVYSRTRQEMVQAGAVNISVDRQWVRVTYFNDRPDHKGRQRVLEKWVNIEELTKWNPGITIVDQKTLTVQMRGTKYAKVGSIAVSVAATAALAFLASRGCEKSDPRDPNDSSPSPARKKDAQPDGMADFLRGEKFERLLEKHRMNRTDAERQIETLLYSTGLLNDDLTSFQEAFLHAMRQAGLYDKAHAIEKSFKDHNGPGKGHFSVTPTLKEGKTEKDRQRD